VTTEALGDCYRWAYAYVLKHPTAVLYQGVVTAPYSEGKPYEHAWVEHGGVVKDWQTMVAGYGGKFRNRGYPKRTWEHLWNPEKVKTFSREQAVAEFDRAGHYGPW
jgi:hypothetical protein